MPVSCNAVVALDPILLVIFSETLAAVLAASSAALDSIFGDSSDGAGASLNNLPCVSVVGKGSSASASAGGTVLCSTSPPWG